MYNPNNWKSDFSSAFNRIRLAMILMLTITQSVQAARSNIIKIEPSSNFEQNLKDTLSDISPGTTVELPEGKFSLLDEVIIDTSHVKLVGKGPEKTILSFKNQKAGPEGILVSASAVTIENIAIEDTPGDGIKAGGVNGIAIRNVSVKWTRGPNTMNGGYGLYPVGSRNVLIEDCYVSGASDAGVYVGQSENIIVRRVHVEQNVAGIEIENSRFADVYENTAVGNTAGILIFDLPNLPKQGGKQTRVFRNQIEENNIRNFAAKGNILKVVPPGVGILIAANDDVEVFGNVITDHKLVSVGIVHFALTQKPMSDPKYDPRPERIFIHDNVISRKEHSFPDSSQMSILLHWLFGFNIPDIVYDGIEDGTYSGDSLPNDQKICIAGNVSLENEASSFGNLHLDHQRKGNPLPGGPVSRDLTVHNCVHKPLPEVVLEKPTDLPITLPSPNPELVSKLCSMDGRGVNWFALSVDCPKLSDYRLNTENGGIQYDLTTPLFTDYAEKVRTVFIPPYSQAKYNASHAFDFPIGTVITKTFSFEGNPVETRVLIHRLSGWVGLPYRWKNGQALLAKSGAVIKAGGTDYNIPSQSKCISCHGTPNGMSPIGPSAKLLNRDFTYSSGVENQIEHWKQIAILRDVPNDTDTWPVLPVWNKPGSGSLEKRARGYLDVNCAHCHNPKGRARSSGLFLEFERDPNTTAYGICKPPVAAGMGAGNRLYDIVPGKPKSSILTYRMASNHLAIRMPEAGRSLVHDEGLKLVLDWIKEMPKKECQ